jgi:hypothetical protein
MGTDNGKSTRMSSTRRIKKKAPSPPPPDAMSVGSQSTEDATSSVCGNSRHSGSVASNASSKDSILKASVLYKEMSNKRRRVARKDSSSRSSGGGLIKKTSMVICAMVIWVALYVVSTYSGQLYGLIGMQSDTDYAAQDEESGESSATRWKSDTVKAPEKEDDPDTQLASLSSGAGTNLWEGVLQGGTSDESTSDTTTRTTSDGATTTGDATLSTTTDGSGTNEASILTKNEASLMATTTDVSLSSSSKSGTELLEGVTNDAMSTSLNASSADTMTSGEDTLVSLSSSDPASLASDGTAQSLSRSGADVAQGLSSAESGQLSSGSILKLATGSDGTVADGTTSEATSSGEQTTLSIGLANDGSTMNGAQEQTTLEQGDLTQTQQQQLGDGIQAPIAAQVKGFKANGAQGETTELAAESGLAATNQLDQQDIAQQPLLKQVKGYAANGADGEAAQLSSQDQQQLGGNQLMAGTTQEGTLGQGLTPEGTLRQHQMAGDVQGLANEVMPRSNLGDQVIGQLSDTQEMTSGLQTNNALQNGGLSQGLDQTTQQIVSGSQRNSILESDGAQNRMVQGEVLNQAGDGRSIEQTDAANSRGSLGGSMLNEQSSLRSADMTNSQASLSGGLNQQTLEDGSQGTLRGTNTLKSSSSMIVNGDQAMLRGSSQQMGDIQQTQSLSGLGADARADDSGVTVEEMHQRLGDSALASQDRASSNNLSTMQGARTGSNLIDNQREGMMSNNADRTINNEHNTLQEGSNRLRARSSDGGDASSMNPEQGASMSSGNRQFMVVNKKMLSRRDTDSNGNDNELTGSQSIDQSGDRATQGGMMQALSNRGGNSMTLQSNDESGTMQQNQNGGMTRTSHVLDHLASKGQPLRSSDQQRSVDVDNDMAMRERQQMPESGRSRLSESGATIVGTARVGAQPSMNRNTMGSSSGGMSNTRQSQEMNGSTQQQGEMPMQSGILQQQQGLANLQTMQVQPSRLRRRLQEQGIVEESYENLSPPALTEYVANHAQYRNLLNFDEALPFDPFSQVPYFWHIHKSGGSSMKHMLQCMGLAQTRRGSDPACNDKADYIHVCPLVWGTAVNADASSPQGIERIKRLGLFNLNATNLVVTTSRVYEALSIFNPQHRGRLFVMLRDPVERAISKFYYTQVATWERNYKPELANMTLVEYSLSHHCYDNWMTRRLIHEMDPQYKVTEGDLRLAKEILRQKALLLLTSNMDQSAFRMNQYFGWSTTGDQRFCIEQYSHREHVNKNPHPVPSKDSPEWAAIRDKNLLDVELYRYALSLYHDQQGPFLYEKFGPLHLPEAVDPHRDEYAIPDEDDVQ